MRTTKAMLREQIEGLLETNRGLRIEVGQYELDVADLKQVANTEMTRREDAAVEFAETIAQARKNGRAALEQAAAIRTEHELQASLLEQAIGNRDALSETLAEVRVALQCEVGEDIVKAAEMRCMQVEITAAAAQYASAFMHALVELGSDMRANLPPAGRGPTLRRKWDTLVARIDREATPS